MRPLIVFLLLSSSLQAQVFSIVAKTREKVPCNGPLCYQPQYRDFLDFGTGTLIGRDSTSDWIITAKHVVDGNGPVMVEGITASKVFLHTEHDIAVLKVPVQQSRWQPLLITHSFSSGEKAAFGGFGSVSSNGVQRSWRIFRGTISDKRYKSGVLSLDDMIIRNGDSGGPVTVRNKEFLGVACCSSAEGTIFTPATLYTDWLQKIGVPFQLSKPVTLVSSQPKDDEPPSKGDSYESLNNRMAQLETEHKALAAEVQTLRGQTEAITREGLAMKVTLDQLKKDVSAAKATLTQIQNEPLKLRWKDSRGTHTEEFPYPYRVEFDFEKVLNSKKE